MSVNPDRKRKQVLLASVGGIAAVGGLYAISQIMSVDQTILAGRGPDTVTTSMIASKTDAAGPEMTWIVGRGEQIEALTEQVNKLTQSLETENRTRVSQLDAVTASYDELLLKQQAEIQALTAAMQTGARSSPGRGSDVSSDFLTAAAVQNPMSLSTGNPLGQNTGNETPAPQSPASFTSLQPLVPLKRSFNLAEASEGGLFGEQQKVLLENYLPAGSYAPALVLSGVDASTGVTSAAEPVPVLFRITGPAVTAGERTTRGRKINLTGCTVTGSARGDLSSERVYVRLLKMACIKPGGEVFEEDVAGYMSGAGKAGSRGLVVSREGKLVRNAGIAGALSGLAGGVSDVGLAGATAAETGFDEAIRGAAGASVSGGVQSAATQLSEYYIERAEQYQPVVSLYGGTDVELVFLSGVKLD